MVLLDHIERIFKFLFRSLNLLMGILVGAVFGALLTIFIIMMNNPEGFSFTGGWYWKLLPGALLGVVVGIKIWPLVFAFLFDADADISELDFSTTSTDNSSTDHEVKCADDARSDENQQGNNW